MAKLLSTVLLQMLFGFCTPCLLEIASTDHLSVRPGEDITLPCNITNYPEISWYRLRSEEVKLLISAKQGNLGKTFSFSYNVNESHFDPTESRSSVSLVIIGVRDTDLGFYFCGGRNYGPHVQFGKPIRLDFTEKASSKDHTESTTSNPNGSEEEPTADQHHVSNSSDPPVTQQSTGAELWIIMSVCAVSILINIICICVFCSNIKGPAHCGIIIIILSCVCAVFVSLSIICSSLSSTLQDKSSSTGDSNEKEVDLDLSDLTSVTYTSVS